MTHITLEAVAELVREWRVARQKVDDEFSRRLAQLWHPQPPVSAPKPPLRRGTPVSIDVADTVDRLAKMLGRDTQLRMSGPDLRAVVQASSHAEMSNYDWEMAQRKLKLRPDVIMTIGERQVRWYSERHPAAS